MGKTSLTGAINGRRSKARENAMNLACDRIAVLDGVTRAADQTIVASIFYLPLPSGCSLDVATIQSSATVIQLKIGAHENLKWQS
jgi:hypothetical protein